MMDQADYRKIYATKEAFEGLRSDRKFAKLLNLARAVNAIYFCFNSLLDYTDDETPAGLRQHINAFLFSVGALHEGFRVADTLEEYFGDRDSYRNGFGRLLADSKIQTLRSTILRRMRNKLVFHYDEDVAQRILKSLDLNEYIFATGTGGKRNGTYYNLADEIVINHLLRDCQTKEEEDRTFREALGTIGDTLAAFVECADTLIGDVLPDGTWKLQKGKNNAADAS